MEGGCDAPRRVSWRCAHEPSRGIHRNEHDENCRWKNRQRVGQLGSACTSDPNWSRSESDIFGSVGPGNRGTASTRRCVSLAKLVDQLSSENTHAPIRNLFADLHAVLSRKRCLL